MNTVLAILAILEIKPKKLSLSDLIISSSVKKETKEETLMGLAQPLAALVENTLDQMIIT